MEPRVADSARRHGVADDDMLHTLRDYIDLFAFDEGFTMVIGPDYTGRILEVGIVESKDGQVIVHAMPAREKFLR